jgi:hypothetical protein
MADLFAQTTDAAFMLTTYQHAGRNYLQLTDQQPGWQKLYDGGSGGYVMRITTAQARELAALLTRWAESGGMPWELSRS